MEETMAGEQACFALVAWSFLLMASLFLIYSLFSTSAELNLGDC